MKRERANEGEETTEKTEEAAAAAAGAPRKVRTREDDAKVDGEYFESYSNMSIHEEMLRDTIRTGAYREVS